VTRSATGELETLEIPDGIPLHHKGQLPSLRGKSGVYMIIQNGATDCYIGSAIDCANRLRNHRAHFRPNKVKLRKYLLYNRIRTLGASVFTFSLLHNGTNFLELFNKTHPGVILKPIDSIFLEAFTKYELVVIEHMPSIKSSKKRDSMMLYNNEFVLSKSLKKNRINRFKYYPRVSLIK